MNYVKEITLDFNAELPSITVMAKQMDTQSRYLLINPKLDGIEVDISGLTAVFCAEKPDGKIIMNYCKIDENKRILLELTNEVLAINGVARCEVKLYKGNCILSSCPFYIDVVKSVSDSGIESSNEYTILSELINRCELLLKTANIDMEKSYSPAFEVTKTNIYIKEYKEVTEE